MSQPVHRHRLRQAPAPANANRSAVLRQWMLRTPGLVSLHEQVLCSRQMWQSLRAALPAGLAESTHPGKFGDGAWTLTVSSSAVAAKLKLYLPLLLRQLHKAGWPVQRIQVRVQTASDTPVAPALPAKPQGSPAPAAVRERLRALRAKHQG